MAAAPTLTPVWKSQVGRWDSATATHLLNRAGFGASMKDIRALVDLGPEKSVDLIVHYKALPDTLPEMQFGDLSGAPAGGKNGGPKQLRQQAEFLKSLDPEQRKAYQNLRQAATRGKLDEMKLWWLDRMVRTQRPLEEKMTLMLHGLFVSSAVTVKNSHLLFIQNQLLRQYATGNFKALALEISRDPAMLEYLNNNQNKKQHPNENYARELMELFTLGIGNYTENDIKESARAFSGWTNIGERFYFSPPEHDAGQKTFLSQTGNLDGTDIVNIIFEQPAASRYLATRLLRFFAVEEPPKEIVESLAATVRSNKFEIAPTLQVLFTSDWFYSPEVMRHQIKSPVQLVVGALRQLGVSIAEPRAVDNSLRMMGQDLFNSPTVKGWDGGKTWINTSTLFSRYNLPAYLGTGRLPTGGKRPEAADVRMQFAEFNSGWSPQIDLAEASVSTTDGVVDLYVAKLIGDHIEPHKREELIEYLNATGDAKSRLFDPVAPDSESRIRALVHLIMAMAEYQLC